MIGTEVSEWFRLWSLGFIHRVSDEIAGANALVELCRFSLRSGDFVLLLDL